MGTVRLSEVRTAWGAWLRGRGRAGKVRCWRLSNTPEWYVAKLATLAVARALPGPIALQYFYAPVNREIEDEHVPREGEFDMGLVPWSPLAYGLLSGKYDRATVEETGPRAGGLPKEAAPSGEARPADDWRLDGANPIGDSLFTQRNGNIVEGVRRVAETVGQTPAPVALASVVGRSGAASTLMGCAGRSRSSTTSPRSISYSPQSIARRWMRSAHRRRRA